MKKKILIEGMSCNHCVMHVKNALSELDGVSNVEVDLKNKSAVIDANINNEKLKDAVEEVGYEVLSIENID